MQIRLGSSSPRLPGPPSKKIPVAFLPLASQPIMFQPLRQFPARPDGAAHVGAQTNINRAGPGNGQLSPLVPQSQDGSFSREMDFMMMMNQQPGVGTADTPAASLRRLSLSGSSRFDHGPKSPHLMGSASALFGDSCPRQQSYT
ncbi:hypothetical protein PAXRUDRAFT_232712 [Paxillus rubicundulus Ve08.2h10]|nr:hypothetical protein PAXRUDRAFT_232712 [Paxillus rubicundulus Ve08.2h10]